MYLQSNHKSWSQSDWRVEKQLRYLGTSETFKDNGNGEDLIEHSAGLSYHIICIYLVACMYCTLVSSVIFWKPDTSITQ